MPRNIARDLEFVLEQVLLEFAHVLERAAVIQIAARIDRLRQAEGIGPAILADAVDRRHIDRGRPIAIAPGAAWFSIRFGRGGFFPGYRLPDQ